MSFVGNSYKQGVRRGCYGGGHGGNYYCRGFRLSPRRFYVHRIRTRFLNLFRLLRKWKTSYDAAIRSLRKHMNCGGGRRKKNNNNHGNNRGTREMMNYALYRGSGDYRLKSFGRSNSFYSEAIADCLDFIKRNSVSMEEEKPVLISS
nr:hypothetical protein A4A49_41782 [Ipomoea trifida]